MTQAPDTRYVLTDAGHVAYQVFGDGPPTVLLITSWFSNVDAMWEAPGIASYLDRLSSFAQVVCFDKRGSGVSDPVALDKLPTLERWMDDALAVVEAVGTDEVAVIGDAEGGPMAMLLAATYPQRVKRLVLVNTFARWRRAPDYPIGMPDETTEKLIRRWQEHWGYTTEILSLSGPSLANDEPARRWFLRMQRLAMPPGAAAVMFRWVTALDVRAVLPSITVPTLILHRRDARHHRVAFGRYLAEHLPSARLVELDGADTLPFFAGDSEPLLDEIERFLVGAPTATAGHRRLVTILISDVVGSTELAASVGDARWRQMLRDHDAVARGAIARFRGEELSHTGDGIVAAFDGPTRAVSCALHLRAALADLGLNVRVGAHTGEVEIGPDGASGLAIHLASRLLSLAPEGGVVVSRTVRDLAFGSNLGFLPLGTHLLKGVPDRWELYRVAEQGVR